MISKLTSGSSFGFCVWHKEFRSFQPLQLEIWYIFGETKIKIKIQTLQYLVSIWWDKDKDKFNIAIDSNIVLLGVDGKVDGKVDWAVENEEEVWHRGQKVDQVRLQIFDSVSLSWWWWWTTMRMNDKDDDEDEDEASSSLTPFPEVCSLEIVPWMMS